MLLEFGGPDGFSFLGVGRACGGRRTLCMHIGSSLLCHTHLFRDMAESSQDLLRSAWLEGKDGALPGREQAKAWALREIWRDSGKADHGTELAINIVTHLFSEQEELGSSRVWSTSSRRT